MSRFNNRQKQTTAIKTLNNEYVRSNEEQLEVQQQVRRQKVFLRRRYTAYLIISAILLFGLFDYLGQKRDDLAAQKAEYALVEKELEAAQEQQEMLKLQISRLEDDEYIAKLARKEYFLSEEGEIIFTIPDKEKSEDEKQ